jgi:hypothetical protein
MPASRFSEGYLSITSGEKPFVAPIEVFECANRPTTEINYILLRLPALLKKSRENTMGVTNGK